MAPRTVDSSRGRRSKLSDENEQPNESMMQEGEVFFLPRYDFLFINKSLTILVFHELMLSQAAFMVASRFESISWSRIIETIVPFEITLKAFFSALLLNRRKNI